MAAKVELQSFSITSAHRGIIRDNNDWLAGGTLLPAAGVDWMSGRASQAVLAQTMGTKLKVHAKLSVSGLSGSGLDKGTVVAKPVVVPSTTLPATGPSWPAVLMTPTSSPLRLFPSAAIPIKEPFIEVDLSGGGPLPNEFNGGIVRWEWELIHDKGVIKCGKSDISLFSVNGKPQDLPGTSTADKGITKRRMEASILLAQGAKSLFLHAIVGHIQKQLKFDGSERNDPGGPWPMLDDIKKNGGTCQAQARLILGILSHLGLNGEVVPVAVYADPDKGGGKVAQESTFGGLLRTCAALKHPTNKTWKCALLPKGSGTITPGKTSFPQYDEMEACLKVTDSQTATKTTTYYAMGTKKQYATAQDVLKDIYDCLAWVEADGSVWRVREIVATY